MMDNTRSVNWLQRSKNACAAFVKTFVVVLRRVPGRNRAKTYGKGTTAPGCTKEVTFPKKPVFEKVMAKSNVFSNGYMSSKFVLGYSFRESDRIKLSPKSLDPYQG
jgi:hypothetical protein